MAGVPDQVHAGGINLKGQLSHPEPVHKTAVLTDELRHRRNQVCLPKHLRHDGEMIDGGGNPAALPLLVQVAVHETMGVARHGHKQMPGLQEFLHGDRLTRQRMSFAHRQHVATLKQPGAPQAVVVLVQNANRQVHVGFAQIVVGAIGRVRGVVREARRVTGARHAGGRTAN